MNIKPLGSRVLLELITENKKKRIILTDKEENENIAKVIEIGEDISKIKKGDKVIFDIYKSIKLNTDKSNIYIVNFEDIFAIVGDEVE